MGPQNSLRTEYVALVSKRKEMDYPGTVMSTQSYVRDDSGQVKKAWVSSVVHGQV